MEMCIRDRGWNVYSEIRRKLAEDYGIPQSEVRFIQEATSEKARKEMIAGMNTGKIRVLFGSYICTLRFF